MIPADWLARMRGRCPVCAAVELAGEGGSAAEVASVVYAYATADALQVSHALRATTTPAAAPSPYDFLRVQQDACARHYAALSQALGHVRGGDPRA